MANLGTQLDTQALVDEQIAYYKARASEYEFNIVKIYYPAKVLTDKLSELGWQAKVQETSRFFTFGLLEKI